LITGFANLKQIISECRKGRVSMNEIAELIGDWSLAEIHPEMTQISRVEVDKNNHVFKIWFKILKRKDDATRSFETWIVLTFVAGVLVAVGGALGVVAYKARNSQSSDPEPKTEVEMSNTRFPSRRSVGNARPGRASPR